MTNGSSETHRTDAPVETWACARACGHGHARGGGREVLGRWRESAGTRALALRVDACSARTELVLSHGAQMGNQMMAWLLASVPKGKGTQDRGPSAQSHEVSMVPGMGKPQEQSLGATAPLLSIGPAPRWDLTLPPLPVRTRGFLSAYSQLGLFLWEPHPLEVGWAASSLGGGTSVGPGLGATPKQVHSLLYGSPGPGALMANCRVGTPAILEVEGN